MLVSSLLYIWPAVQMQPDTPRLAGSLEARATIQHSIAGDLANQLSPL